MVRRPLTNEIAMAQAALLRQVTSLADGYKALAEAMIRGKSVPSFAQEDELLLAAQRAAKLRAKLDALQLSERYYDEE